MPADAPADEKKTDKYPEKMTIRACDENGKKFFDPQEVAFRKGKTEGFIYLNPAHAAGNTTPHKGSEMTDKDGVVWVSVQCDRVGNEYRAKVEKKK